MSKMKKFGREAANIDNTKWPEMIKREEKLYKRENDMRSEFCRDYTRIIHSTGYRRMKHKTQVFFSPKNDHICTRIEHVTYVESISCTIANNLGLNTELTKAIATAHDIGHSPFGHKGEKILSQISTKEIGIPFWHEKNGLEAVDNIELLDDPDGNKRNLNLTYAVRDGIISHCGEINENNLRPRNENIDLNEYKAVNQYAPYTWEGCVIKIADKISYLGRDIIDAVILGILDKDLDELYKIIKTDKIINNTVIINELIKDLCENSTPENGLCFSEQMYQLIKELKEFNYKHIYFNKKLKISEEYFELILNTIYNLLKETYTNTEEASKIAPTLINDFEIWLQDYWTKQRKNINQNKVIYNPQKEKEYYKAIIQYISGMTDNYAIEMYEKIINF